MLFRLGFLFAALVGGVAAQNAALEHFEKKIRPVFASRCYGCHTSLAKGGLRLDSSDGIKRVVASGALLRALSYRDKDLKMPPGGALPPETVAEIELWVKNGAPVPEGPKLWSLQKPRPVDGTIDKFIADRLAAKGLKASPEADRRTLIRRVSYDLTGLPPSAEEIEQFERDSSAKAYEALVDRLLASPRYGERWGRHWLDVARYSDSYNDSVNTGQRYAWSYTYRDWVIRAFNEDLPYDQFVLYQIAADKVKGADPRHLAALGYLSLGREFPNSYPETVDDRIDAVTRGFMGMTVACARCHDHKFDPIPTKDYYSLYGIFSNIREPAKLPLLGLASSKPTLYDERLEKIDQVYQDYRKKRHAEMVKFFRSQDAEYQKAVRDCEGKSNPEIEELVRDRQLNSHVLKLWRAHPDGKFEIALSDFEKIYTEGDSNNTRSIKVRYNMMLAASAYDGATPRAMAIEDVPDPQPAHVFLRGNPANPGAETPPHFLSCLGGSQVFQDGRLELARAIIDPSNPLTARVMVNRIWMHHFGSGLVRTPSDFGNRGEQPTHPELLDYLAVKFVEGGWSVKKIHRLILLSSTYKQSSEDNAAARAIDPDNQFFWRANRRRLEIEAVRDSMLAVAGRLDLTAGGIPYSLVAQPSVPRRSVYAFIERGRLPGVLNAFDFASPDQHAPMRFVTTVPQQALFFLNSPFIAEQSRALADRVASLPAEERVRRLYRYVFGRVPTSRELQAGLQFVAGGADENRKVSASAWQYGIEGFQSFPVFVADRWQGGSMTPARGFGKAVLRPAGGEPDEQHPVVRRWVSPVSGTMAIEGTLRHNQPAVPYGDGVRGRIVSSRDGELASYVVNGGSAETKLSGWKVEKGDTIDFIVDCRKDPENDAFAWAPVITVGDKKWVAKDEFAGPPPQPLPVWARYAQVLLQSNEFSFVD